MSKIRCVCGEIIEMISVPNPFGFIAVKELDLDQIESAAETRNSVSRIFDEINDCGIQGYRCAQCSRLIMFECGRDGEASYYKMEVLPEA